MTCQECTLKFKSKNELKWHMQETHSLFGKSRVLPAFKKDSNGMYPCKSCPKLFADSANIRRHVIEVHHAIFNNCKKCDNKTKQKQKLNQHLKSVHLGMTWDCKQCPFQGSYPDPRYAHSKIHS